MGATLTPTALWHKHQNVARAISRDFRFPGWDHDDVVQEAYIALWKAAKTYDHTKGATFPTFARLIVKRHLITRLNQSRTKKNELLSQASRDLDMADHSDARSIEARERLSEMIERLAILTPRERIALAAHLNGCPPTASKSHNNSLTRAREKLANGHGRLK